MMDTQVPSWQDAYRTEMNPLNQVGILLLSSTVQVVYPNPEAHALLQEFTTCSGPAADFPPSIRSFCQELIQMLPATPESTDWGGIRLSRVTDSPTRPILVRAFGVSAVLNNSDGQFLLLIEPIDQTLTSQAVSKTQVRLTPREGSVARYLLEGLTNKEIANKLRLSEHPVKDHLKRLMRKYQVTTRTALASRLFSGQNAGIQLTVGPPATMDSEIHALAV